MPKFRKPDEELNDVDFLEAMKDVRRLEPPNLAPPVSPSRPGLHERRESAPRVSEDADSDSDFEFIRPGVQRAALRKLRNPSIPPQAELDLHGFTLVEAERAVRAFIAGAERIGRREIRIIHGKGLSSPAGKPVLKAKVMEWLRRNELVLAFCAAGPAHGGAGALHVLLKRK